MAAERVDRPSARILLLDPAGRVLLFRFDAIGQSAYWATPGGALDPGEDYRACARRELREETGLDADCGDEVARRIVEFVTLQGVPVFADERYFLARTDQTEISADGHSALERELMREWRWFSRDELKSHGEPIFPEDLAEMLETLAPHE
jgi:8-oxo-dGTP diphosphatase